MSNGVRVEVPESPTWDMVWEAKKRTAEALMKFPRNCPYCGAEARTFEYIQTLGHQVSFWCGTTLNDNGGSIGVGYGWCGDRRL